MTTNNETTMTRAQFADLLDIYGADRKRWPGRSVALADHLLEVDAAARQLLAEAVALDRLLDRAPQVPRAREDVLVLSIVAAALKQEQLPPAVVAGAASVPREAVRGGADLDGGAKVIAWPGARQTKKAPAMGVAAEAAVQAAAHNWRSAALLAASLVLGIYIGLANARSTTVRDMFAAVGVLQDTASNSVALDQFYLSDDDEEAL